VATTNEPGYAKCPVRLEMAAELCCEHCVQRLGFGPRLKRILFTLVKHAAEWEHDPDLEIIRFRILDRGADCSRVVFKTESRERLEEVA
jgi:hypothetical protein